VRIVDCSGDAGYGETRFDSRGFTVTPLVTDAAFVAVLRLEPGGRIGRHSATGRQVFCVVEGRGRVTGDDRVEQPIHAGQAAVWEPGEEHETGTDDGMTAVVSEGPDVALLLPLGKH
jgi:quercetin dioxygenase-like cupin family protein